MNREPTRGRRERRRTRRQDENRFEPLPPIGSQASALQELPPNVPVAEGQDTLREAFRFTNFFLNASAQPNIQHYQFFDAIQNIMGEPERQLMRMAMDRDENLRQRYLDLYYRFEAQEAEDLRRGIITPVMED